MKVCKCCGVEKALEEYHNHKSTKDKKRAICKVCTNLQNSRWVEENKEKRKEAAHNLYLSKKDVYKENNTSWRKANREKWNNYNKVRLTTEEGKVASAKASAKRRAYKGKAAYSWEEELNDFLIKEMYQLAKLRAKSTGIAWHVDHVIPLKGKLVCGLHIWNNLEVIPGTLNCKKSNHFEVT
jgi:hypothetical protein